ncbi:MAG: filamentous hemagglutinin N-terminal domain-containing protein [Kiritimatiellaeota bacterium]|nr:filamentous hemagglutinin N-terminal domain-containing protein [Kiritimatiellota bacterium]
MKVFNFFRGRMSRVIAALALWGLLAPMGAFALPQGGSVRSGDVSWGSSGGTMTVNQQSARAIINWNTFSIGSTETVQFNQPDASAAILNRVTGPYSSDIFGSLLANGNVYLINPNGILFGAGARINVGGLVASTFDISDDDFNLGKLDFKNTGNSGKVVNRGSISAASFAYLIGAGVENHGTITTPAAALAAGHSRIVIDRTAMGGEIRLSVDADMAPISFTTFDAPQGMANVINTGVIDASGATGGDVALQGVNVVQSGTIRADGIEGDGGRVRLFGERLVTLGSDSVTTANAGRAGDGGRIELISRDFLGVYERAYIAARGGTLRGNGGFVETSGHERFVIEAAPDVGAYNGRGGEWLIDPRDITIVAVGDEGWVWNDNDMFALWDNTKIKVADILSGLANGDVTIHTGTDGTADGDIHVNADIGYAIHPGTTLTLDAARDVNLNANVTAGADNTLGLTAGRDVNQNNGNVQVGTVDFDVAGDVTMTRPDNRIGTLTGTVGGNLDLANNRTLNLDGLRVADGTTTLNVNGDLTDAGANTLADLTVRTTGDIVLDAANDLGAVTANANNGKGSITLRDAAGDLNDDGIVLRNIDGGTLTVIADDGSITQQGGTRVQILADADAGISGATDLTAADQITLFNRRNDFGGPVSARAAGIQLRDRNSIVLDEIVAGVDGLTVRTDRGAITQMDGYPAISVLGETRLTARNGRRPADILLENGFNNFVGAVHADGRNIALTDVDSIRLGRIDATRTLTVHADGGDITQTPDGVRVRGETTLFATGDITLDNPVNDFINGPVHAKGINIALTDANDILLGRVEAGNADVRGTLDVIALDGDITQTADGILATGEATFTAEGNAIALGEAANDFQDTVNAYANDVTLTDGAGGISIGRVKALADPGDETAAETVVITALNGGITDAQQETVGHDAEGFATMDGPRIVNIIANNLLLLADGDIGAVGTPLDINAGTLAARSLGGSIWLFDSGALTLGTVNGIAGLTAANHAKVETLNGPLTVDQRVLAGGDVLLAANGPGSDVTLNALAAAVGNLTVLAARDVAQNALLAARQTVDVEAKGGAVTMGGGAATVGGTVAYYTAGDMAVTRIAGGNVRLEAEGSITDANLNNAPNILAQNAQLVAGGSVGGAGGTESDANPQALNTIVGTLAVDAGQSAYIRNTGNLEIGAVAPINVNRVALDSTTTPLAGDALSGATAGNNLKILNTRGALNVTSGVTARDGDLLLWAQRGALDIGADVTAGNLLTLAGEGVRLGAGLLAGGDLSVNAGGGSLTLGAGYSIDAGSARLTADGDIALDRITARDVVSVVAGGDITDANADDTANITAARVRLQASGSIGSGDGEESDANPTAVNVAAGNLEAIAEGNIYLQAEGGLTIGGVGDVTLSEARFDSGATMAVRDTDLTGVTAVNGVAKIKAGALTVDEGVTAGTDALLLTTEGDLTLNAALNAVGMASLFAAGNLNQNADITAGGDIFLSGASILTASGIALHGDNVRYASTLDALIGNITANGLVNIVAGRDIIDANHDNAANIVADRIRLEAGGSVGSAADALDIEANTVAVQATGEAYLRSQGDITIGRIEQVETDYARFDSGTTTVIDPPLAGLTTGGNASLVSVNGNIGQTTGGDVFVGGTTRLEARNGDVTLENANNDFVGQVDGVARNIYLRDRNDLFVGQLAANGHVRLTAAGSILAAQGYPNVIAGTAEFYSGRDIGHPLYISVGTIINAIAGGNISLTQVSGNMNILGQVYAGGNVRLDVLHGGIVDADGDGYVPPWRVTPDNADIYSGGTMTLIADFVGTLREPVEIIAGRGLWLGSHRPPAPPNGAFPWVVVNGRVGGGARNIHVNQSGVPGLVIYNGQPIWGPWWTMRQFQLAQRSLADNDQPNLLDSGIVKLPWFLHPDMSLLSPAPVRDDLREAEEKGITGLDEDLPEDAPRTKALGLPVTMMGGGR